MAKTTEWVPEVKIPDPKVPTEAQIAARAAKFQAERDARQADEDRARATHDLMREQNRDRDVAFALAAAVDAGWSVPSVVWPESGAAPLGNRGDVVGFGAGSQWLLKRDGVYVRVAEGPHKICSPVWPVGVRIGAEPRRKVEMAAPNGTPMVESEHSDVTVLIAVKGVLKWRTVELATVLDDNVGFGANALRALIGAGLEINTHGPVLPGTPREFGRQVSTGCDVLTHRFLLEAFELIPR